MTSIRSIAPRQRHTRPRASISAASTSYSGRQLAVDNAYQRIAYFRQLTAGIDVRLIQLRNLLAGTRPPTNPLTPPTRQTMATPTPSLGAWRAARAGQPYYLPNGTADFADTRHSTPIQRRQSPGPAATTPVPGRWGEAASIPGVPFTNPRRRQPPLYLNLVRLNYANPIRAGYSFDVTDLLTAMSAGTAYDANSHPIFPRDAADDNYNAFDAFPPRITGEVGDADFYDAAGALLLPVERMRRFVTPVDINGSGRVAQFRKRTSNSIEPAARTLVRTTTAASSSPATTGRPGRRA